MDEYEFLIRATVAGIVASFACGLGALPLLIKRLDLAQNVELAYGFTGGMMFAASVYNLILPALESGTGASGGIELKHALLTVGGILSGAAAMWILETQVTPERVDRWGLNIIGGRREVVIFIVMACHSIPEGVAVGVGYGSAPHISGTFELGNYIALAIAIHNIPEGLAMALPLRARGASITKCFVLAFLTSLPQPIAAIPASMLAWFFAPLVTPLLGAAAGAMIYLVLVELIPDALRGRSEGELAWSFILGFSSLILIQVLL